MVVILADGQFPQGQEALAILDSAELVVCCDGAAKTLLEYGREPDYIIGDLDSLPAELKNQFADRLEHVAEQESNDLSKAFRFCRRQGWQDIVILGATGKREDHTLGNLSLLSEYAQEVPDIKIVTDYGYFTVARESGTFAAKPGMQVSIIALDGNIRVSSTNLKYPMKEYLLRRWWNATLNEATADEFTLDFTENRELLVYRTWEVKQE